MVASAGILLLLVTVRVSMAEGKEDDTEWKFSLWVVAMVLLSPTAWPHYLIFLLIPFSRLVIGSRENLVSPRTAWLGLTSAAFVFSCFSAQLLVVSPALAYMAMYSFGSDIEG